MNPLACNSSILCRQYLIEEVVEQTPSAPYFHKGLSNIVPLKRLKWTTLRKLKVGFVQGLGVL